MDWPRCDAPSCKFEAEVRADLEGEDCQFHGYLCREHLDTIRAVLPASFTNIASLRPVVLTDELRVKMQAM